MRVMTDLAGSDEAARVGRSVGYPNWSVSEPTDIPVQSFTARDVPVALNAVVPWGCSTVGVALDDGVGDIDLASVFEVYDVSYAARAVPSASPAPRRGWDRPAPRLLRSVPVSRGHSAMWSW